MIPTMILFGLLLGRWWKFALIVGTSAWTVLLRSQGLLATPPEIVGAAALALVNTAAGVLAHSSFWLSCVRPGRRTGRHGARNHRKVLTGWHGGGEEGDHSACVAAVGIGRVHRGDPRPTGGYAGRRRARGPAGARGPVRAGVAAPREPLGFAVLVVRRRALWAVETNPAGWLGSLVALVGCVSYGFVVVPWVMRFRGSTSPEAFAD